MIQKKVCMLGAFATGKTSLVSRFVKSIFSDKYLTTVGVKIDKKVMRVEQQELNLILWDLEGEDEFHKVRKSYLRGSAGYLLVVDGTRRATLEKAVLLQKEVEETLDKVPFVVVLNKTDLAEQWEIGKERVDELRDKGWCVFETSAKAGHGIQEVFLALGNKMLGRDLASER